MKVIGSKTPQTVLDRKLLEAIDRAARRTKQNRWAFVRDVLREHLQRLEVPAMEEHDRLGYLTNPDSGEA